MTLSKPYFLLGYYINSMLLSKIGGMFAKHNVSSKAAQWEALHIANSGHDDWLVVGNGPSLSVDDLEALANIPSLASNKITLLYDHTQWRPTVYTVADPLLLYKLPKSHFKNIPLTLIPHSVYYMARTSNKLAWRLKLFDEGESLFNQTGGLPDPVDSGFIGASTVTNANIQFAMWCGAKTIYVIGCDHNYSEEKHSEIKKLSHGESSNHFHPDYRKQGEIVNNAPVDRIEQGYALMQRIADHHGVRIINISRRTALHAFERGTVEQAVAETTIKPIGIEPSDLV